MNIFFLSFFSVLTWMRVFLEEGGRDGCHLDLMVECFGRGGGFLCFFIFLVSPFQSLVFLP